jgi:hypothetical protein
VSVPRALFKQKKGIPPLLCPYSCHLPCIMTHLTPQDRSGNLFEVMNGTREGELSPCFLVSSQVEASKTAVLYLAKDGLFPSLDFGHFRILMA